MTTRIVSTNAQVKLIVSSRAEALKIALITFSLGSLLVFVAGFAYSDTVHNAAHDTRHTLSFPCH
jgi:cobalt transporter subunit CbtB